MTAATLMVLLAIGLLVLPRDGELLRALQLKHVPDKELRQDLKDLSGEIGNWGDFAGYNLVLVVGCGLADARFARATSSVSRWRACCAPSSPVPWPMCFASRSAGPGRVPSSAMA
jgi:hypothetical protein